MNPTSSNRYIYAAPNGDGRWKVWGSADIEFTEEVFNTKKQAIHAIPQYAKLLGWVLGSYTRSIDE